MDILSEYKTFGDYFIRFKPDNIWNYNNFIECGKLSEQAIHSLNNLEYFIKTGNICNTISSLGLYSYIADREEFEEYLFEGFVSLESYPECILYEYYYNKYDDITIYVYMCSKKNINKLNYLNKNKCLFL